MEYALRQIATIHNGFSDKFGIPRQGGLTQAQSVIVFEPEYRNADALRGLEEFSHLWLIWVFSEFRREGWSPTVRPPRLGGNERKGVFATRSPNRPNPLGLSVVEIVKIELSSPEGPRITVRGADILNGTPILDIKPYLPYADAKPQAKGGFAHQKLQYALQVEIDDENWLKIYEPNREIVRELLSQDPRPAYQRDPERVYAFDYDGQTIRFTVDANKLTVTEVTE